MNRRASNANPNLGRVRRPAGVLAASFILDGGGTVLGFDEGMEALTGWSAIDVVGQANRRIPGRALASGSTCLYEGEIPVPRESASALLRVHTADDRTMDVEALVHRLTGPGDRVQVTVLRVLSRSSARQTEAGGVHDPLTGLLRSRPFRIRLEAAIETARDAARPVALVLADIDHFRRVNDERGREAGDAALRQFADLVRVLVGDDADVGRVGYDDIAMLLPRSGRGEARQVAATLRSTVERHAFGDDERDPIRMTLSIGSASYPADADRGAVLLERAHDALEEARSLGRNRVWCYLRRPRVPVEAPVFFDGSAGLLVGYTRDLSPSGVFVQTAAPIDIGMRCAFNFPLPGEDGRVHVIGRVVRSVPPDVSPTTSAELRIPGMGVEFEHFGGPEDQRVLERFLHVRESTTHRPESGFLSV